MNWLSSDSVVKSFLLVAKAGVSSAKFGNSPKRSLAIKLGAATAAWAVFETGKVAGAAKATAVPAVNSANKLKDFSVCMTSHSHPNKVHYCTSLVICSFIDSHAFSGLFQRQNFCFFSLCCTVANALHCPALKIVFKS
jgi:hypothetical protein